MKVLVPQTESENGENEIKEIEDSLEVIDDTFIKKKTMSIMDHSESEMVNTFEKSSDIMDSKDRSNSVIPWAENE